MPTSSTEIPGLPKEFSGVTRLPVEPYTSPAYFEAARDAIFRRKWLCIGMTREIPKPGGRIVRDVLTLAQQVLVKRSGADTLQGFLVEGGKSEAALRPVALQTWREFIFVNFAEAPEESLETALGETGLRLRSFPFERFTHRTRFTVTLDCNWMVAVDAFQEAYHAGYLHGRWTNKDPRARIIDYSMFEKNRSTTFSTAGRHPATPIQAGAQKHGRSGMYTSGEQQSIPCVNPEKYEDYMADINAIFPNIFINMTSKHFWTHQFWPISHNTTFYETTYYHSAPENYAEEVALTYNGTRILAMLLEDFEMLGRLQRGLESGALKQVILGESEALAKHFLTVVEREVADFRPPRNAGPRVAQS